MATLAPGTGKTHRSYLWAYATGEFDTLKAVVYDFTPSRAGEHARRFLGDWQGSLVCDDFAGDKASFAQGVIEVGCMAHARRKFVELHLANKSHIAASSTISSWNSRTSLRQPAWHNGKPGPRRWPPSCTSGSPCTGSRCLTALRSPRPSITA